jgi:hypothetical protein
MEVPIRRLPDRLRCSVCKAPDPHIIVLCKLPLSYSRVSACSGNCVDAVHMTYARVVLRAQLEAAARMQ